ncbi:hypothetical protein YQE_02255, partial [Dendroctonus ponderosae]
MLPVEDLHVQLEEDEHESFVLSPTSSQAGEVDPDSFTADDNRETWGSNTDFLLSIIGFAVDLANIWRFPYLCYKNGGGAFLIPYTLMLVFGAVPLFYMELILGQFNRQGPISLWRICPLFKGKFPSRVLQSPQARFPSRLTWSSLTHSKTFSRAVLEMQWSDGLHEMGYPKWQLVVCLILIYCLLYVSLFKGVKSSGKVVWVTATMPYVVLSILLVRGLMLPGALGGISYYLQPELSKLKETQVWVDAAVQIFYSVGAGFGVHLSYASYNTFHNNCYRDCIITTVVNCFTSFFSGFVIFTYLGYMSHKQGVDIKYVATEGPGLVFQVYPEAVATLPGSHLWSVLFFFMLIMLGVDSAMGGLECVITGLMDEFSSFFRQRKYAREIFTLIVILTSFSVALINVTPCVVMFGLLYHQPLVYNDYSYPNWAEWVGWSLALSSIMMIPLGAIIQLCKTPGSFKERVALSISPVEEHEEIRRSKLTVFDSLGGNGPEVFVPAADGHELAQMKTGKNTSRTFRRIGEKATLKNRADVLRFDLGLPCGVVTFDFEEAGVVERTREGVKGSGGR